MRNLARPGRGAVGTGPAWGVVAVASGGGAVATAIGGVATGHPLGGLVIAGCVLLAPWLLAAVLVVATTLVALRRRPRGAASTDTVAVIDALHRVIETVLGR